MARRFAEGPINTLARTIAAGILATALVPAVAHGQAASAPATLPEPPPAAEPPAPQPARLPLLTLDAAVNAALQHQPAVLQAVASEKAAEARVGETRASLLPSIVGQIQALYSNPIIPGILPGSSERLAPGISITQTLFDYGSYYRWRAAQASVAPLKTAIETTDEQAILNVRSAYFGVLAAEALVAVSQEQVDDQEKHLEQIRAFVQVGTHPKIDLITATVNLDNAKLALVQAQNGVLQSKVALQVAMGLPGRPDFEVQETALPPVPGESSTTDQLLQDALRARPDVRQLDQQISAQQLTVEAANVQIYYPTLSVTGSWAYLFNRISETTNMFSCPQGDLPISSGGGGFGGGGTPPVCVHVNPGGTVALAGATGPFPLSITNSTRGNQWSASAILSWPLYAGGLNVNTEREQEANLNVLEQQRESLVLTARSDIESALLAIANDKQQLELSEATVEQSREQWGLAQARYDAGVGNIIELSDAEVAVANAESQLVKSKYALATDRAKLAKALGE